MNAFIQTCFAVRPLRSFSFTETCSIPLSEFVSEIIRTKGFYLQG